MTGPPQKNFDPRNSGGFPNLFPTPMTYHSTPASAEPAARSHCIDPIGSVCPRDLVIRESSAQRQTNNQIGISRTKHLSEFLFIPINMASVNKLMDLLLFHSRGQGVISPWLFSSVIHLSSHTLTERPSPICHCIPSLIRAFAPHMLLHARLEEWPRSASRIFFLSWYLALIPYVSIAVGFLRRRQICLAKRASLKVSMSLKFKPPSSLAEQRINHIANAFCCCHSFCPTKSWHKVCWCHL